MYAVVEDGGKQYMVKKGDTIHIETRELPDNAKSITFDRVLMVGTGADSKIGQPLVEGATVTATLEKEMKGPKLDIVKFRRRKGYHLKKGHRQNLLKVTIDGISA
jgi:large subunit ribosomal protein L21